MSKGFGRLQRMILGALETDDYVILRDLLPEDYRHSQVSSLYRAAGKLEEAGLVHLFTPIVPFQKNHLTAETMEAFERKKATARTTISELYERLGQLGKR